MKTENRILYGALVMVFFLIAGVVGTVSAAGLDQTAQLKLEVDLLQQINQLNLTNAQIDQILPILKNVQGIMQKAETDLEKLLAQEKQLLLQRKTKEVEALQVEKKVIREKAVLQVKTALVDLQKILTPEQMKKLQGHFNLSAQQKALDEVRAIGKKDVAYLHGSTNGVIKMETQKGFIMVEKKANMQGKDVKVEENVVIKVSMETAKMILQKQEERLKELETQLAKAKDQEKNVLQKHIDQCKDQIANLKKAIDKSTDGTVIFQLGMMGNQQFMMKKAPISQIKIQQKGTGNKEVDGQILISKAAPDRMNKGKTFIGGQIRLAAGKTETLSILIKVLEELRNAK